MSMRTRTQVMINSNDTLSNSSYDDPTEFEQSIDALLSRIHQQQQQPIQSKAISEEKRNKRKYDALLAKIKKDKITIEQLQNENRRLKEEIARCQAKIKSYPKMMKKYEQLSDSLSKSAEAYSMIMSLSPRKRQFA